MQKELTLKEAYALLSEGKKLTTLNWNKYSYIHIVADILKDNHGNHYCFSLHDNSWVEYEAPQMCFADFVENKLVTTNMDCTKGLSTDIYTYKVICRRDNYVVLESVISRYPTVLFKAEFEDLKRRDEFVLY